MEWDTVRPYRHKKFKFDDNQIQKINNLYSQRLNEDPNLKYLAKVRERYNQNKDKKLLSLNINTRKLEKEARRTWLLEIENNRRKVLELTTFESFEELEEHNKNENKENDEKIDLNKDFLLIESTKIVNDYINMNKKILLSERD